MYNFRSRYSYGVSKRSTAQEIGQMMNFRNAVVASGILLLGLGVVDCGGTVETVGVEDVGNKQEAVQFDSYEKA